MNVECPACGSRDTRVASSRSFQDHFKRLFGVYPARCRACSTRFSTPIVNVRLVVYAHCPKCMRYELTDWMEEYHRPRSFSRFKLLLGGKRYRCEFCRCNFVSFRRAKRIYTWSEYQAMRRTADRT